MNGISETFDFLIKKQLDAYYSLQDEVLRQDRTRFFAKAVIGKAILGSQMWIETVPP